MIHIVSDQERYTAQVSGWKKLKIIAYFFTSRNGLMYRIDRCSIFFLTWMETVYLY